MILASGGYASTLSGYVISVLLILVTVLLGWVAKTLFQVLLLARIMQAAIFPEGKKSLPDQVEDIRDDTRDIRRNGSDKLAEILETAKITNRAVANGPHE